jgi:aldose 1-epimerase
MARKTAEVVALRAGRARLEFLPAAGGSITRYCWEADGGAVDWLRPNAGPEGPRPDPLAMACFPLVPFSSRIREGRFVFQGRQVSLPLNFPPERHAIHGQGWQAPWMLAARSESEATIEYRHRADAWPWDYCARQTFALRDDGLSLEIEVTNTSRQAMPAGIGFHPYFIRTPEARITADVAAMWQYDGEVMPVRLLTPPPEERDPGKGVVAETVAMDNTFTGWNRQAEIVWPEWQASLTLTADPLLQFLVVFTPPGEDFFCVEPVSNWTDAFNTPAEGDGGARILAPGESLAAKAYLSPRLDR